MEDEWQHEELEARSSEVDRAREEEWYSELKNEWELVDSAPGAPVPRSVAPESSSHFDHVQYSISSLVQSPAWSAGRQECQSHMAARPFAPMPSPWIRPLQIPRPEMIGQMKSQAPSSLLLATNQHYSQGVPRPLPPPPRPECPASLALNVDQSNHSGWDLESSHLLQT